MIDPKPVEAAIVEKFTFLRNYGFNEQPNIEFYNLGENITLVNTANSIGVSLHLDLLDEVIDIDLVRLVKGKIPRGDVYFSKDGSKLRIGFFGCLLHVLGLDSAILSPIKLRNSQYVDREKDLQYFIRQIESYQSIVEHYMPQVLTVPVDRLFR